MASSVADIFHQAAQHNLTDTRRQGNVINLEAGCEVIVAGDIHGNRTAMSKILSYFSRPAAMPRRLILQEIIHGPADEQTHQDRSVELLLRAARAKLFSPKEIIFLLGNHDIAQVTGGEITKDSCNTCQAFAEGVKFAFGDVEGEEILQAINDFLMSMPLAVRCPNGVFISHSLPSPKQMAKAGTEILTRPFTCEDLLRGGPVYEWTWGRGQSDKQLDALATELGVNFFILGHRPTPVGCEAIARRAVTVACDHEHGCIVRFVSDQPLDVQTVIDSATPLVAIE